jgi:formylglycine-generating enzyme required for sulfatase activity
VSKGPVLSKSLLCLAATLCIAACDAQSSGQAAAPQTPTPQTPALKQSSALQALVAKTKKNLMFAQGGSFQMGDFGAIHNKEKLPYYGALDTMPLHKVSLDSFSIAAYKTTYEDYDVYTDITGLEKIAQNPRYILLQAPHCACKSAMASCAGLLQMARPAGGYADGLAHRGAVGICGA